MRWASERCQTSHQCIGLVCPVWGKGAMTRVFCGVEGGASFSKVVLVNENAEILSLQDGASLNYLLLGMAECQKRIHRMIVKAVDEAGLDPSVRLAGLGLCLSGCEQKEGNEHFEKCFRETFPSLTDHISVASDTMGSVLTASPKGGLVLIAGTGSNALLINPNGTTARCGGLGHLLGDEAAAIWISLKAVKMVFDYEDNFSSPPHSIERVKEIMLDYFQVKDQFGILQHCYTNFSKTFIAGLCAKLAEVARDEQDPLCKYLFHEAGKALARHVMALAPKVHKSLVAQEGGLPIVCVGSVFKSWDLLKEGFHAAMDSILHEYTLLQLTTSAALGAAYFGAKAANCNLPLNFKDNYSVLYHFKVAKELTCDKRA